jgi:hypothetical protein
MITNSDKAFLNVLRGSAITTIVLIHIGLSWFYLPYSSYIMTTVPLFFFISGAVSYSSFLRDKSSTKNLYKRVITIAIPYYLVLSSAFIFTWLLNKSIPTFNIMSIFNWLTFNVSAERESMPLPYGQVWFLHALFFIYIIAIPYFVWVNKKPIRLLYLMFFSIFLTLLQQNFDIAAQFNFFSHNLYSPLSNICFFIFGAFVYAKREILNSKIFAVLSVFSFLAAYFLKVNLNLDSDLNQHTAYPDFFYILSSFAVISLILLLQGVITKIIFFSSYLEGFILFMNKHTFSIYLIHALVLTTVHHTMIGSIEGKPWLALMKIVLVIFLNCLVSIPLTYATNKVKNYIMKK